jgi:transposase
MVISVIADGSSSGWTTRSWHIDAERSRPPHPKVVAWLERHPRWIFHFTPTSGSWLNAVETFFSVLTRRRIRRGAFSSIVDLQAAINRYLAEHNADPKPFIWTATPASILAKLDQVNASVH